MLELINIKKSYGNVQALKGIDLSFRDNEFVSILGPSGCGKTTFLNIVGGLDRYTSGDLKIRGKSTKSYQDKEWDAYRNKSIGFVFQSYNLIPHLTVLQNVELAMKLSGVSKTETTRRAKEVLEKVGLADQLSKRPNQMSGGQMQRVAIARALVNDPEIILADEPTGALDSKTSVVVMDLLKEIARDKLVIMVTHNADLAHEYSNRVIEFKDGEIINDSNPFTMSREEDPNAKQKMTSMSYMTALSLSGRNLIAKKGRTLLTSFAGSIGIIGIALVLALSSGLSGTIDNIQQDTLASSPITIEKNSFNLNNIQVDSSIGLETFPDSTSVTVEDIQMGPQRITNKITKEYIDYINAMDKTLVESIQMTYDANMNILYKQGDEMKFTTSATSGIKPLSPDNAYTSKYYEVLEGAMPSNKNEAVLIIDSKNIISGSLGNLLGFDENFEMRDAIGKEYGIIANNDFYTQANGGLFTPALVDQYEGLYNDKKFESFKIVGVLRQKEDAKVSVYEPGVYVTDELVKSYIDNAKNSNIVNAQKEIGEAYSVITGQPFISPTPAATSTTLYETFLGELGGSELPSAINIVPANFESKDKIKTYLDDYNNKLVEEDRIIYNDLSEITTSLLGSLVDTISYVLIAFSSISLIVSSVMIGIITYASVIERTKEIGVLRSLGARKKDVSRVFNAETFLIGLVSGLLGITITYLLQLPINAIVLDLVGTPNIAALQPGAAAALVTISVLLTSIAGLIPSRIAAKKDPVVALRSE